MPNIGSIEFFMQCERGVLVVCPDMCILSSNVDCSWPETRKSLQNLIEFVPTNWRKNMKACFGCNILVGSGQKVAMTHPCFYRSKNMFNGWSSNAHGIWFIFQSLLNIIQYGFMIPTPDTTCFLRRAARFKIAIWTSCVVAVEINVALAIRAMRTFGKGDLLDMCKYSLRHYR